MKLNNLRNIALLAASAALLTACGTGTVIKDDGTTDEAKWHAADSVHFDKDQGTFPNMQSLSQVRDGMTKDQIYELLGRPQYSDGWRPREWNYLFLFNTPGQGVNGVSTCQYKVLFDTDSYARSFYWNPVGEGSVCPGQAASSAPVAKTYTLGADALFAFDRSGADDMNAEGRSKLDQLAEDIQKLESLESVTVYGYTDRLGSVPYNQRLSQNRANTVKAYLVDKGVPAEKVTASAGARQTRSSPARACVARHCVTACSRTAASWSTSREPSLNKAKPSVIVWAASGEHRKVLPLMSYLESAFQ